MPPGPPTRELVARAHRRLTERRLMQRLMADIEKQLTRRVQNAVDRPGATKWRRSVAGRAPFATKDPPRESQSRELTGDIATPSDVTADGIYRKMVHETRSERRRSLRTDEMAPNDTQVGTLSTAPFWGGGSKSSKYTHISERRATGGVLWAFMLSEPLVPMITRSGLMWRGRIGPCGGPMCALDAPCWRLSRA